MSRAINISSVDMKELSSVGWNSLTKKKFYFCKRCSNTFPQNSQFHKHKLLCNPHGQDDPNKIPVDECHNGLSKEQAEEAASAVIFKYSGRPRKKEKKSYDEELIVSER
jgi:hypothetical protein